METPAQQPVSLLAVCERGSGKGRRLPVFGEVLAVPFLDAFGSVLSFALVGKPWGSGKMLSPKLLSIGVSFVSLLAVSVL